MEEREYCYEERFKWMYDSMSLEEQEALREINEEMAKETFEIAMQMMEQEVV